MKDKIKYLKKLINNKNLIISTIILLIINIFSCILLFQILNNDTTTDLNAIDSSKSNDNVYFDINMLTDCIATCSTNSGLEKYYLAADNYYMIILEISNKKYRNLSNIVNYTYGKTDIKPQTYRITGITKPISEELKNITIKYYNEVFPESNIDSSNFSDYFGEYYVRTTTNISYFYNIILIITITSGVFFIVCFVKLLIFTYKTNKTIKKYY